MKNILLTLCLLATMTLSAQTRGPQRGTEFEYPDAHSVTDVIMYSLPVWASCHRQIS